MKRLVLVFICILAFGLRLYRINNPLADWHSWRQADTAAVSRNFIKFGFDILHPRFDDLSNVPSGKENPRGYRFVEFPIYNLIHAFLAKTFNFWPLEAWGRLVSIFSSLGSLAFLYLIVKKYLGERGALLSAFFFAVLPFNIYYSRVILPEPMMIMASLGGLYFFSRWINQKSKIKNQKSKMKYQISNVVLAVVFAATSFLLKPFSLVYLFPVFYIAFRKWRFDYSKWLSFFILLLFSLLPFFWWRWWMNHFPEGIPANNWLFNAGNIRFKGAWFYWLFAERVGKLILGYWGIFLFALGLIIKPNKKEGWFFYFWLLGILAYFSIIAAGNVQHDYYQVLAVPVICVFLARGADFLLTAPSKYLHKAMCYLLFIICFLFMFAFSWYQVRDFFNINNLAIVEAGKAVDKIVPKDAKVIAPYGGDTAFLYQTNRQGWPIGIEIEKMVKLGANYYVNVNFGPETRWVMEKYKVLKKTKDYIIVDLQ